MFRNYLVTALRNLRRNWLYGAISILGLSAAFAAAILIAQFVRGVFSYAHWIPGYRQVYKVADILTQPGQPSALRDPDTVGITRPAARKYFHRDLPIGYTLQVQTLEFPAPGKAMRR